MWTYSQSAGSIKENNGEPCGLGYSGKGEHKNIPSAQDIKMCGPIPRGIYRINAPQNTEAHGPFVLPLTPDPGNTMFGRSGFLIHGDSIAHPGGASEGCIILPKLVREMIWSSGDWGLLVVA